MVVRTRPSSDSLPSRPANCDCAPRLQNERMPPRRVSWFITNADPVSRLPPPRPLPKCPRWFSPPSVSGMLPIGFAPPSSSSAVPIGAPPPRPGVPSEPLPATGETDIGWGTPAPTRFAPSDGASRLRNSTAISRSMPGRTCRPATWPRKPVSRCASIRSCTCSTTCTAAARPNRAKSAFGSGSRFSIVPVASPSVTRPPEGLDSRSVSVSSPSSWKSSSTVTSMLPDELPDSMVSIPLAAV